MRLFVSKSSAGTHPCAVPQITANDEEKETDAAVNNGPRRFAMWLAMVYFIMSLVFYTSLVGCKGPDFEETQRIVIFLSAGKACLVSAGCCKLMMLLACTIIVIALVALEEFSLCLHRASQRHPKKDGKSWS